MAAWWHHPENGLERIRKDLWWCKTLVSCFLYKLEAKTDHVCVWVGPRETWAHLAVASHASWHCPRVWPSAPLVPTLMNDVTLHSPVLPGQGAVVIKHTVPNINWLINRRNVFGSQHDIWSVISWKIWTESFTRLTCSWCSLKYALCRLFNHILYPLNTSIFLSLENDIHYC